MSFHTYSQLLSSQNHPNSAMLNQAQHCTVGQLANHQSPSRKAKTPTPSPAHQAQDCQEACTHQDYDQHDTGPGNVVLNNTDDGTRPPHTHETSSQDPPRNNSAAPSTEMREQTSAHSTRHERSKEASDIGNERDSRTGNDSRRQQNPYLPGGRLWRSAVVAAASDRNPRGSIPMAKWMQEWDEGWEAAD